MKTAIQEAIEIIEERLKILSTVQVTESTMGAIAGYQYSKYLLMELLEKEKEQIMNACIRFGNLNGVDIEDYIEYYNEISKSLKPIDLPSDWDIDKEAFKVPFDGSDNFYDKSFIKGAKWMKEQILITKTNNL
jgi:hypothetical protein